MQCIQAALSTLPHSLFVCGSGSVSATRNAVSARYVVCSVFCAYLRCIRAHVLRPFNFRNQKPFCHVAKWLHSLHKNHTNTEQNVSNMLMRDEDNDYLRVEHITVQ